MEIKIFNPKKTKKYHMPTTVFMGRHSLLYLTKILSLQNFNNILVVSGKHFKMSKNYSTLQKILKSYNAIFYTKDLSSSDFSTINELTDYCKRNKIDILIGIGGGSVLDVAKSASTLVAHDGEIEEFVKFKTKQIIRKGLYYIAIPTTSGTGSEVTPWATIWGDDKKKYSFFSSKFTFPDVAIIDPQLTDTLPPKETATSGIDALCQAIEAYWNVNHNQISDQFALKAISLITKNLELAVNKPNQSIRDVMAKGSLFGGLAFSNTQTTICHAISYPITAHWGIPHGQATSITLPAFIKLFVPLISPYRQKKLLKALGAKDSSEAAVTIETLIENIGLHTKLSALKIPKDGINTILEESYYTNRMSNTPMDISKNELKNLLFTIY